MKVEIRSNGCLMILPETEFEEQYITLNFGQGDVEGFVKCGLTPSEIIGIKIKGKSNDNKES
jgi:hypothetical protein